jgi:hypothetical protein
MSRPLTLPEAAAELRKTPRWLREWLRAHPRDKAGEPYYTPVGRDKIFELYDITRIKTALREEARCPSGSDRRAPAKRRTLKSAAPSEGQRDQFALKRAAELLNDPTLLNCSERSKTASSNTDAGRRPKLRLVQETTS